ncbi:MAG: DUF4386 family protein [Chloroflexi bacterium]|nr:DUF4386 family protein [Chloroflexota bacterium]
MFWADRTNKVAGVTLLLLAALVIVNLVLVTAAVGDADPVKRGDIEGMLRDINDNKALFFLGTAFSIATDAAALLAAAAMLYLVFCDRSRVLALLAFVGLLAAGIAFLAADTASLTVGVLAADFVEKGGAGGIAADDPVILQSARAVAAFSGLADPIGNTALGFGLLALGSLLARAPEGEVNPPRWLGGLAILSGLAMLLGWVVAADTDTGIVVISIGIIGTLLLLVILGGWLLIQPERGESRPATA